MIDIKSLVVISLCIINGLAFFLVGFDKWMAHGRQWRIPEKTLWILALCGGSIGTLLGMRLFRHKTRKTSFQLVMMFIVFLQLGIILAIDYFLGGSLLIGLL